MMKMKKPFSLSIFNLQFLIILLILFNKYQKILTISAYWTPILSKICSPNTTKNITQQLFQCDKLMDKQLSTIFDDCVRNVHNIKEQKLSQPKLCYYLKNGLLLDRCKMSRYQSEGITLPELVDKEQDHTWCLMKIAQPLGWEKLCSDNPNDISFLMIQQTNIQTCEQRFYEITKPIRDCFRDEIRLNSDRGNLSPRQQPHQHQHQQQQQQYRPKIVPKSNAIGGGGSGGFSVHDRYKPAACLSFQYSRKIWKCLSEKENQQIMQRRANMYISCLRAIRQQYQLQQQQHQNGEF